MELKCLLENLLRDVRQTTHWLMQTEYEGIKINMLFLVLGGTTCN